MLLLGLSKLASPRLGVDIVETFKSHNLSIVSVNFLYNTKNYVRLQEKANLTRRERAKQAYKEGLFLGPNKQKEVFTRMIGLANFVGNTKNSGYTELVARPPRVNAQTRNSIIGSDIRDMQAD